MSSVPKPARLSCIVSVDANALPNENAPEPTVRLRNVVTNEADGTSVRDPPGLLTTMFGSVTAPFVLNVAAFAVSNVHVVAGELIAIVPRVKFPLIVILGTVLVPLPEKVRLWYVVSLMV